MQHIKGSVLHILCFLLYAFIYTSIPLTHAIYENYKLLPKYFIHIWTVPRESYLLLYGLNHGIA